MLVLKKHRLNHKASQPFLVNCSRVISTHLQISNLQNSMSFKMASNSLAGSSSIDDSSSKLDLKNVFSEENKQRTISVLRNKATGLKFLKAAYMKRAAVLIPLCTNLSGEPCLLYTLRSLKLSKHSGEICFPGGTCDESDNGDDVATALRETEEELNLNRDEIEIWSVMSPMPTASSLLGVTPVIGYIKRALDADGLKVNAEEVEKAFLTPLVHFCKKENWGRPAFRGGFAMPVYKNMRVYHPKDLYRNGVSSSSDEDESSTNKNSDDNLKEVKLWGLTAILTHVVLESLIPNLYKLRVPILESKPKYCL